MTNVGGFQESGVGGNREESQSCWGCSIPVLGIPALPRAHTGGGVVPGKVGEPQEGGGSLGRWGIPRKVGAPQEGWGALAHPGFHGDTKQRMLENLRMNSASHSIPGTCLILGKKGMLIPCSRSFLPEEH